MNLANLIALIFQSADDLTYRRHLARFGQLERSLQGSYMLVHVLKYSRGLGPERDAQKQLRGAVGNIPRKNISKG